MAVPRHLVLRIGRSEISISLRTSDAKQATLRCRELSNAIDRLFAGLPKMRNLSKAEIEDRVLNYFQVWLNKGAELTLDLPTDPMVDVSAEIASLHDDIVMMRQELVQARFSA